MSIPRQTLAVFATIAVVAGVGCNRALTPEEASAKGDALLKELSKNLSALQTFAYTAEERRERDQRWRQDGKARFATSHRAAAEWDCLHDDRREQ